MKTCESCQRSIPEYFTRCQHCGGLPARENLISLAGISQKEICDAINSNPQARDYMRHEALEFQRRLALAGENILSRQRAQAEKFSQAQAEELLNLKAKAYGEKMLAGLPAQMKETADGVLKMLRPVVDGRPLTFHSLPKEVEQFEGELVAKLAGDGAISCVHFIVETANDHYCAYVIGRNWRIPIIPDVFLALENPQRRREQHENLSCVARVVRTLIQNPAQYQDSYEFPFRRETPAGGDWNRVVKIEVEEHDETFNRLNGARLAISLALDRVTGSHKRSLEIQRKIADTYGLSEAFEIPIRFARDAAEAMMREILS